MASDGANDGSQIAVEHDAEEGNQFDGKERLERFSALIAPGKTILDAGCGDGLPVDAYLVKHGLAVNGIDASARMIERATKNVPEAFYEVRDVLDLQEGEYCVDGVISLRAMLHIPGERYPALLRNFASFMPNGGALLVAMAANAWGQAGQDAPDTLASRHPGGAGDNTDVLEDAGFTIILNDFDGLGDRKRQIILARS